MSEWFKEPVLKTGEAQVSVGSNPTLSATLSCILSLFDLRKYPRGRRGSPAKGVGWIKPARGFKSLLPRQVPKINLSGWFSVLFCIFYCRTTHSTATEKVQKCGEILKSSILLLISLPTSFHPSLAPDTRQHISRAFVSSSTSY